MGVAYEHARLSVKVYVLGLFLNRKNMFVFVVVYFGLNDIKRSVNLHTRDDSLYILIEASRINTTNKHCINQKPEPER